MVEERKIAENVTFFFVFFTLLMILIAKHQCNTKIKQIQSWSKSKIEIKTQDPVEKNQKDYFLSISECLTQKDRDEVS